MFVIVWSAPPDAPTGVLGLATGAIAGVLVLAADPAGLAFPSAAVAPVVVLAAAIDLRWHRLPDRLTLPGAAAVGAATVVAAAIERDTAIVVRAVAGAAVVSGLLLVIHLFSPGGMGFGDVKFGLLLGFYLGEVSVGLAVWALLLGSLIGVALALPVAVARRSLVVGIPFGPALAAGTVLTLTLAGPLVG